MIFNKKVILSAIEKSKTDGIKSATTQLLKDLGVKSISIKGSIPSSGPLLIISNHPGGLDSLILLSSIERKDYYFIALFTYGIFGQKMKERLLPIYRIRHLNHKIFEYPLSLQITGQPLENFNLSEIHSKNRQTISNAAQVINRGNAVSIFPSGSAGKRITNSKWKAGIGYLVKNITNLQTQVVFVKIQGTRLTDLVAFLHPVLSKLLFRPKPISIIYSKPRLLSELVNFHDEGKAIANRLEELYNSFIA